MSKLPLGHQKDISVFTAIFQRSFQWDCLSGPCGRPVGAASETCVCVEVLTCRGGLVTSLTWTAGGLHTSGVASISNLMIQQRTGVAPRTALCLDLAWLSNDPPSAWKWGYRGTKFARHREGVNGGRECGKIQPYYCFHHTQREYILQSANFITRAYTLTFPTLG